MDLAQLSKLQPPKLSQSVHREECTQCFDNQVRMQHPRGLISIAIAISFCLQDGPLGIDVCLTCFNGGCLGADRNHALTHYKKTGHKFVLNVKRRRKPSSKRVCFHRTFPAVVLFDADDEGRGRGTSDKDHKARHYRGTRRRQICPLDRFEII